MQDVTKDRDKFIGGSDIAAVLNISKFKTRWQLLQEKAGIAESDFKGNAYTEYGNILEPQIRDYINQIWSTDFVEGKIINGYMRYHADGVDYDKGMVLEIKTTSTIHEKVEDYNYYLCQLLTGMEMFGYVDGILAVYERPEDFNEEFDADRLTVYSIKRKDYEAHIEYIKEEVERFRSDWLRLLDNPFLSEEELQPTELVEVADKVLALESQIEIYKQIEAEYKAAKAELKAGMEKYHVKGYTTPPSDKYPKGIKLTLVLDGEDTIVRDLDIDGLKRDLPELFRNAEDGGYMVEKVKKGRSGYVRITAKKA